MTDDFFECAPGFDPSIGPEWDAHGSWTASIGFDIEVDASPPLAGNPACLSATITHGDSGRIAFLHYREFEGDTYTDEMLEQHMIDALNAFIAEMVVPCWWKDNDGVC